MYNSVFAAAAWLMPLCAGLPLDASNRHGGTDEPCREVRDLAAKWVRDNSIVPKNISDPVEAILIPATPAVPVPSSLALACLKSVPLHKDSALQHVHFLRPLFEWESTVDYLRDPPQGYLSEGVNLIRGLDDIVAKLDSNRRGGYNNEFEFLADLRTLTSVRPRDFHFSYETLLLDLFSFPLAPQFISISEDGLALPKVYLYDDVKHADDRYTPSPVATIDGVPAMEFLQRASVNNGLSHDPDARFNGLVRSLANDANLAYSPMSPFALDLEDRTTVQCENGTKFEFINRAFLRANFTNITSGADLYRDFGQGNGTAPRPLAALLYKLAERNYSSPFAGYPKPFKATKARNIAGYLPEGEGFSDVAVLAVNSFTEMPDPTQAARAPGEMFRDFNQVTVDLISAAKAANRTKLVLDLQGNSGGLIPNIFALYFALFPCDSLPILWEGRVHPQFQWVGEKTWNASAVHISPPWPLPPLVKPDGTKWSSFKDLYGPFPDSLDHKRWGEHTRPALLNTTYYLELFTRLIPLPDVWKYQQPWSTSPFRPEDIIILTDGQCGSACAITVSALTHAHGIRTVALGGRPLAAPMQAIGQTKGGPITAFSGLLSFNRSQATDGLKLSPDPWDNTFAPPLRLGGSSSGSDRWSDDITVNGANIMPYNKGNASEDLGVGEVPLQFRYEAANCKLFYTWDMARDITAVWKAVVSVAWREGRCVPGSTTNEDGTMGGVPGYDGRVEDRYRLGKGVGAVEGR